MRALTALLSSVLLVLGATTVGADAPRDASAVLEDARQVSAVTEKPIFIHFGASWCLWCRRLNAFLADPDIKPIMEKHFVVVAIDVHEHADKAQLENPHGLALLNDLGGEGLGLPFFAVLDSSGKRITDSRRPGETGAKANIGFPVEPEELSWFGEVLRRTVPSFTPEEAQIVATHFRALKTAAL